MAATAIALLDTVPQEGEMERCEMFCNKEEFSLIAVRGRLRLKDRSDGSPRQKCVVWKDLLDGRSEPQLITLPPPQHTYDSKDREMIGDLLFTCQVDDEQSEWLGEDCGKGSETLLSRACTAAF